MYTAGQPVQALGPKREQEKRQRRANDWTGDSSTHHLMSTPLPGPLRHPDRESEDQFYGHLSGKHAASGVAGHSLLKIPYSLCLDDPKWP